MKRSMLSLAVAASLSAYGAGVAAAPFAVGAGDYPLYFSGATASAQFVRNALIDRVCDPAGANGDITVFQKDADDFQVICDLRPAVGADTVRFVKQGGGSGDGTTPISQPAASPLSYPAGAFTTANCDAPVNTATGAGTPFVFYNNCVIPEVTINGGDIGTSDVEPQLFFDVNTPSTGIAFTGADAALIDVRALAGLGFGLAVTTSLRNALQALQFPVTSACHPANADHGTLLPTTADVDGDGTPEPLDVGRIAAGAANPTADVSPSLGVATVADSEECMPNLTSAEVAGLVTGKLTTWDQIQREGTDLVSAATAAGVAVPTTSGITALDNQRVHLCRRDAGSGTNAQFQAFFLRRPCANINGTIVAESMLETTPSTGLFNQPTVILMNRGSSDLGRCLNALENDTLTGNAAELFNDTDANPTNDTRFAWGIGYQSVEKNQNLARGWRFAKVDGLAPTLQNTYLADYTDHFEQTCQIRKDNSTVDAAANGTVLRNVFDNVCGAGVIDVFEANQNFLHAWGQGGWLAVPDGPGGAAPDAPATVAALMNPDAPQPVSSWTRSGQSCSAPTVLDPVQSTLEENLPKGQTRDW